MERPEFPHTIDSTIRSAWCSCPQKFYREYLQHWSPVAESVHLVAGGAFARGMEVARQEFWDKGNSPEESITTAVRELLREYGDFECPPESPKSPERMIEALTRSFDNYGWGTDYITPYKGSNNKHMIEFRFGLPVDVLHPVTGNPIIYCGRFDMVGMFQNGAWVVDDKTSGSLGNQWVNQWNLRGQVTGYCWAAREYGLPIVGAIMRGVGILKTKITFAESIQYRTNDLIDRWYEQLLRDIEKMKVAWEEGYYDYNFADACASYSGCQFAKVCTSSNPEHVLENEFVKRVWRPLEIAKIEEEKNV